MTFTVTATSSTRMRRLADRPSLRTPRNRWQSPTLRLSAPWGFSLTLKSSSVWEGTREKGISQWSSIFTGARAGAPLLESPRPRQPEMGAASVAASHSSLATPQPPCRAALCRVSQASCQVPGARASAGCCPVLAGMTPSSCPSQQLRSSWAPGGWGTSEGEEPPGSGASGLQCVQKVDYRALVTP